MKNQYTKLFAIAGLALLLISCSLLNPSLASDQILENPAPPDKSANLARSVLSIQGHYCSVETGYADGFVNLRDGASVTFQVLLVLPEKTRLEVLEEGNWLKVKTETGVVGYINARYCK